MTIYPPLGKQKQYPPLNLTVIHAAEKDQPAGRDRIQWTLLTELPVDNLQNAVEKLDWYSQRWKIETYHKQVWLQGRRIKTAYARASDLLAFHLLHRKLADILAVHGKSCGTNIPSRSCLLRNRTPDP